MSTITSPLMRTVALVAILGSLVACASSTNVASTESSAVPGKFESMDDRVENRIKTLHEKLEITGDQEEAWNQVAQTMRDNESTMKALFQARHRNSKTMTAVQDLESYKQMEQARVDSLGRIIVAFEPLYGVMSDDQKKNADQLFSHFEMHHDAHMAAKKDSAAPKKESKKSSKAAVN